jgi:hypothetical protein
VRVRQSNLPTRIFVITHKLARQTYTDRHATEVVDSNWGSRDVASSRTIEQSRIGRLAIQQHLARSIKVDRGPERLRFNFVVSIQFLELFDQVVSCKIVGFSTYLSVSARRRTRKLLKSFSTAKEFIGLDGLVKFLVQRASANGRVYLVRSGDTESTSGSLPHLFT